MNENFARSSNVDCAADSHTSERAASLPTRLLIAGLRGYKLVFSIHFAGSCRFVPSCADYAREALLTHGALVGSWLTLKRLARCHPLCAAGLDPVPPRRQRALRQGVIGPLYSSRIFPRRSRALSSKS